MSQTKMDAVERELNGVIMSVNNELRELCIKYNLGHIELNMVADKDEQVKAEFYVKEGILNNPSIKAVPYTNNSQKYMH
jgi:hypothetical protein